MSAFCYKRRFEHRVSSHGYLEMCFSPKRLSGCQCQDWTSGAGWLVEPVLQVFRQMVIENQASFSPSSGISQNTAQSCGPAMHEAVLLMHLRIKKKTQTTTRRRDQTVGSGRRNDGGKASAIRVVTLLMMGVSLSWPSMSTVRL